MLPCCRTVYKGERKRESQVETVISAERTRLLHHTLAEIHTDEMLRTAGVKVEPRVGLRVGLKANFVPAS